MTRSTSPGATPASSRARRQARSATSTAFSSSASTCRTSVPAAAQKASTALVSVASDGASIRSRLWVRIRSSTSAVVRQRRGSAWETAAIRMARRAAATLLRLDAGQDRLAGRVPCGAPAGEHRGGQHEHHEARRGREGAVEVEIVAQEVAIVDVEPDPGGDDTEEEPEERTECADGGRLDHHRAAHGGLVGADDAPERQLAPALPEVRQQEVEDAGERHDDDEQLDGEGEGVGLIDLAGRVVDDL